MRPLITALCCMICTAALAEQDSKTDAVVLNKAQARSILTMLEPWRDVQDAKAFVVLHDGRLHERWWSEEREQWTWVAHGMPKQEKLRFPAGPFCMGSKVFVVSQSGNLWERSWHHETKRWNWVAHGHPPQNRIVAIAAANLKNEKIFTHCADGSLMERFWNGKAWTWVAHQLPDMQTHADGKHHRHPPRTVTPTNKDEDIL